MNQYKNIVIEVKDTVRREHQGNVESKNFDPESRRIYKNWRTVAFTTRPDTRGRFFNRLSLSTGREDREVSKVQCPEVNFTNFSQFFPHDVTSVFYLAVFIYSQSGI